MSLELDLYLRLSQDPRALEAGIDRQRHDCRKWCDERGATIRREWVDNDISATTGRRRPSFEAMLTANPPGILTWHIDRLVRKSGDLERVINLGVNVYAVHSGHVDLSNPAGRATARTIVAWATYEGEQKAVRQSSAAQQRARQGRPWWSSRPFGFEMDGLHRQDEADALRTAYDQLLTGMSLRRVARLLNEQGHLTCRGNLWRPTSLKPVLINARNAGIRTYGRTEIGPAAWQPIVPEETWRAATRLLNAQNRGPIFPRRTNLLTGVATCGVCGSRVKVGHRGGRAGTEPYSVYVCVAKSHVSHRVAWTDDYVRGAVIGWLSRPEAAEALIPEAPDVLPARARAARLRLKLSELQEDYTSDVITRSEFRDMSAVVRERLLAAERELALIGAHSPLAAILSSDIATTYDALDTDSRRGIIQAILSDVILLPRGRGRREMSPEHIRLVWAGQDN